MSFSLLPHLSKFCRTANQEKAWKFWLFFCLSDDCHKWFSILFYDRKQKQNHDGQGKLHHTNSQDVQFCCLLKFGSSQSVCSDFVCSACLVLCNTGDTSLMDYWSSCNSESMLGSAQFKLSHVQYWHFFTFVFLEPYDFNIRDISFHFILSPQMYTNCLVEFLVVFTCGGTNFSRNFSAGLGIFCNICCHYFDCLNRWHSMDGL